MSLRYLLSGIAVMAACVCSAAPQVVWLNPVHDFGAFREEVGPVSCTFKAVNVGDEPVVVVDARANCGCTRPIYSKEPVNPGDTLKVVVTYLPAGRPGRFHKQVKVTTNASAATLGVKGTVIGAPATLSQRYPVEAAPLRISNDVSPFGSTRKGRVLAAAINMYNPTPDTITPGVVNLPPYINALIRPERIAPGEQATVSMTAYTDRCPMWDVAEDSLLLVPDMRYPHRTHKVSTVMIINEDFSKMSAEELERAPVARLSADAVDCGVIDRSSPRLKRTLTLANKGDEPLLVRRIYTPDPAVEVEISSLKIKPGKHATITVTVDPGKIEAGSLLIARITLIINDPASPRQIIRVVGE